MAIWKLQDRAQAIGILAALVLAFMAQYLFTGEAFTRRVNPITWEGWTPNFSRGSAVLLAALVCAAWATARQADTQPNREKCSVSQNEIIYGPIRDQDFYFLTSAGVCYAITLLLYWTLGETWIVQIFWLLGIGLVIVGLWRSLTAGPQADPVVWWEWALVTGLTLAGFGLRYWRLTEIPSQLDQDIPFMGTHARELIWNSNYNWIGASLSGHLLSYDQSLAWSMRLFGQDHYGLVMHSVVFGTLTLPLVFLLGREAFGSRVGLIATTLLATEYTPIHFSRIMFGPAATFFAVLAVYLLLLAMRRRHTMAFAAAGVAASLGIVGYDSSRVIPVIFLAVLGWELLWRQPAFRTQWRNWVALTLGGLIGFGPMLGFALFHFNDFVGRGNVVMIWEPHILEHEMNSYQVTTVGEVLLEQTRRTFLTLHLYGDRSPHFTFPRPMVSAVAAGLWVVGLGYCLTRIRNIRYFTMVAWLGLTFVLGGVLTYDPPYWPHLNIALPAVAIIAGLAADKIIETLSPPPGEFGHLSLHLALVAVLVFTGIHNWSVYYDFSKDKAGPKNTLSRYIRTLPPGYQVYLLNSVFIWNESAFRFFNSDVHAQDILSDELFSSPPPLDKPTLFILYDDQALQFLKSQYPGGKVQEHYNWEGWLFFVSYDYVPLGFDLPPKTESFNPLVLPGWWLIGGALAVLGSRAGFLIWKRLKTAWASEGPFTLIKKLTHRVR